MPKNCTAEISILRTFEKMGQTNVYSNALLNVNYIIIQNLLFYI